MSNTEIFLPLNFKEYKENKITLLRTNLKTVESIERLNRINELRKLKHRQRKLLQDTIKELKKNYVKIKALLPTEKELRLSNQEKKKKIEFQEQDFEKENKINEELSKIREKIKSLNF